MSYIESIFRAYQYIVLAQVEDAAHITQRNYYIKLADSLQRFSSLFPIYSRGLTFDQFRKRLMSIWMGYQEPSTILGLTRIAGAYTDIPLFAYRFMEDPDVWIINVSYLNQTPPDNYIIGTNEIRQGAVFETFGWAGISAEVKAEFKKIFTENATLGPFGIIFYDEAEPFGHTLLKDGYNNFDLMILDNMHFNGREVHVTDYTFPASFETYPISMDRIVPYGYITDITINLFERLYSDSLRREIQYSWGSSPSPASFGPWTQLKYVWPMRIPIEGNYVKFRFDIYDLLAPENYTFVSLMMRGV